MKANAGRPQGLTGKAPVLSAAEVKRLLKVASTGGRFGPRNTTIIAVSYWLGLRAKEIAALKVGDVYDASSSIRSPIHLRSIYTKGMKSRDLFPSSDKLRGVLRAYADELDLGNPNAPLFPTRTGRHFSANGMVQLCRKLYVEAGIERGSSHSGRRTLLTALAERGVDLKALSVIAGHSSIKTTAGYVESNPLRLSQIMEQVDY